MDVCKTSFGNRNFFGDGAGPLGAGWQLKTHARQLTISALHLNRSVPLSFISDAMAEKSTRRTLSERRIAARSSNVQRRRVGLFPFTANWHSLPSYLGEWNASCSAFFTEQKCCSYCGYVAFAGSQPWAEYQLERPTSAVAPYALANCFLAKFCVTFDKRNWYVCGPCSKASDKSRRGRFVVFMTPAYVKLLLTPHPLELQLLSVLDVRIDTYRHYRGFVHGTLQSSSLLDSPFVLGASKNLSGFRPTLREATRLLLHQNLLHNPVVQKYLCNIEKPHPDFGVCFRPAGVVEKIVSCARDRNPIAHMDIDTSDRVLSLVTSVHPQILRQLLKENMLFQAGELIERSDPSRTPAPLEVWVDGLSLDQFLSDDCPSLERCLVPFLFPFGSGSYDGSIDFCDYVRLRTSACFSAFTLYPPYIMFLYQLRQCKIISTACNKVCLEKDIYDIRRRFPDYTEQMLFKRIIKHSIPASIAGLPNWFLSQFKDLLCMVEYFGLPDFFVTVTADEVSESKWLEIEDLTMLLRAFNTELTWADAPVECARLFHDRLQRFARKYLFDSPALLGRILHYMIRYEVQSRGSVHAHIVLWVDKADVPRVTNEIVACIPGRVDELGQLARPEDPMRARLYDLVCRKQLHVCRSGACVQDGRCKSGYPFDSHFQGSTLDSVTNRWKYFRPRHRTPERCLLSS